MKGMNTQYNRWLKGGGPSFEVAVKSYKETLRAITYGFQDVEVITEIASLVQEAGIKFLRCFYERYVFGNLLYNMEVDTAFKKRRDDLLYFVEGLNKNIEGYVVFKRREAEPLELENLHYYPNSKGGELVYLREVSYGDDDFDFIVTDIFRLARKPKIFACLMRCVLKVFKILKREAEFITREISTICFQLALQLVSVSGISGFFTTLPEEKVAFLDEAYDRLTVDRTAELQYFRDHDLYELLRDSSLVERDILVRTFDEPRFQGLYIQDVMDRFLRAIRERRDLKSGLLSPIISSLKKLDKLEKVFKPSDLYVSVRSNPGEVPDGFTYAEKIDGKWVTKRPSEAIIKSAFEDDILNCPEVDEAIQYCYKYNEKGDRSYNGWVRTIICIDNPNKYKPRIIHLFVNCINDRLMFFNNRAQLRHKWDPILCTDDHKVGRDFVRDCTSQSFRMKDENSNASLILADWSDATDNMEQKFFLDVVEAFDCKERRQLWEEILKIPFVMLYPNGTNREGFQRNGQPQGGPDSFTSFCDEGELIHAVAHYLMQSAGTLVETLRAVGDDSCKVSRDDPEGKYFAIYSLLCSWAGLKINASKSSILKPSDPEWSAEFCKVTSVNGNYFSKIPHKLMFNSCKDDASWLSLLVWCQTYGYNTTQYLYSELEKKFPKEFNCIKDSLEYGWSAGLSCYKKFVLSASYNWTSDTIKFLYAFVIAHIRCCVVDAFMADRKQEELEIKKLDPWEQCYKYFHNQKIHDKIIEHVNPNHKLMVLMDENYEINRTLRDIMTDEIILSECNNLPSLTIIRQTEEGFRQIEFIVQLWRELKARDFNDWDSVIANKQSLIVQTCLQILLDSKIHQFSARTLGKKASNSGKIYQKTLEIFNKIKTTHESA